MWRAAAWNTWNTPSRLVANMVRHSSSVRSTKARLPPPPMPAFAKQPSTRPNVSSVAFIASCTEAALLTSQMRVSTLPGPSAMVAAATLFFSALRPQIETLQPAALSACAMPSPIPPLPPVTTATRPERSKMVMVYFLGVFPFGLTHVNRAFESEAFLRHHGQARLKNQIWVEDLTCRATNGAGATHEETMQFK